MTPLPVDRFATRSGLVILIVAPGPSGTNVYVCGQATILGATSAVAAQAGPNLDFTGSWLQQSATGADTGEEEITFHLTSMRLVSGSSALLPGEAMRAGYWIGAVVQVYAAAVDGVTWSEELLGQGTLVDSEIGEDGIEVRVSMSTWKNRQAPVIQVAKDSMTWGTDEGEAAKGSSGSPFPMFWGDFDIEGRLGTLTSSSPFYSAFGGSYLAGLFGIKYPMIPLRLVADKYIKPAGSGLANTARLLLLGTGDTTRRMTVLTSRGLGGSGEEPRGEDYQLMPLWTWDGSLDQGTPFVHDMGSVLNPPESVQSPYHSGGDWTTSHGAHTTATAANSKFHAFWIARTDPDWGTSAPAYWMGTVQAVALRADALTQVHNTVSSILFSTVGPPTNPLACLTPDFVNYTTVPSGGRICIDFQADGPRLGEIRAIRIGVSLASTSPSIDTRIAMRRATTTGFRLVHLTPFYQASQPAANIVKLTTSPIFYANHYALFSPPARQVGSSEHPIQPWTFWDYDVNNANWPVSLVLWPNDAAAVHVYAIWMEPIYTRRVGEETEQSRWAGPWSFRKVANVRTGRTEIVTVQRATRFSPRHEKPVGNFGAWTHGKGPREDVPTAGRYFGAAYDTIRNPASIALHYIDVVHSEYSSAVIAADTFGSFRDVYDHLGGQAWPLAVDLDAYTPSAEFMARLGSHSRSIIARQQGTAPAWRMFLDTPDPATDFPERLYKTDGRFFTWNEIDIETFRARLTSWHSLRNHFLLRYGLHSPSGEFAYQKGLSQQATDLATDATAYKTLCSNSVTRYGAERPIEIIELPWVWKDDIADEMLKYYADTLATPRITVSFRGFFRAYDLLPGHVVKFADEIGDRVPYPGFQGGAAWSGHQFNVLRSERVGEGDGFVLVDVELVEAYTAAA